jgi:hypothetical protein
MVGSEFAIENASAKVPKPIAAITEAERITPVILEEIVPSAIQELLTAIDLFAIFSSQSNSFKY